MVIRENRKLEFDISEGQVGKRSNSNVAVTRSSQDVGGGVYIISFKLSQSSNTSYQNFFKRGKQKVS